MTAGTDSGDMHVWAELRQAVRALHAVVDHLPPELDRRAVRLFVEADRLRADWEAVTFPPLGVHPTPSTVTLEMFESDLPDRS